MRTRRQRQEEESKEDDRKISGKKEKVQQKQKAKKHNPDQKQIAQKKIKPNPPSPPKSVQVKKQTIKDKKKAVRVSAEKIASPPKQQVKKRGKSTGVNQKGGKAVQEKKKLKDESEDEKQEVKTFTIKGKFPIDEYFSLDKTKHRILEFQGKAYSVTLNQTSVQANSNKFYLIQLIQAENAPHHVYFFARWGRVGYTGQMSMINFRSNINEAIAQYNSKYNEKHKKGNYRELEMNYEAEEEKKKSDEKEKEKKTTERKDDFKESKLHKSVKELIELIFDLNMMNKQMIEIGYNVSKMPLGKLSKDNILKGFKILEALIQVLKEKNPTKQVQRLTDDFYSIIPHDFGFTNVRAFILDSPEKVKKKIQMLEALSEIKVATNILSNVDNDQNQIDANYAKLKRQITSVSKVSSEFEMIDKYLQTTHAKTHNNYDLELVDLFSLKDQREDIRYTKDIPNKMLLWHGSRLTNFVGILSQGLRIAPPEAPVTGYMFGKGVYFADMSSKSANYCFTSPQNNTGILLLCEVALGDMNLKYNADYNANILPPGKSSTKGVGRTSPSADNEVEIDGVKIPMGPGEPTPQTGGLLYNQFIVYDVAQIKIRYLLRTKFNYKRNW